MAMDWTIKRDDAEYLVDVLEATQDAKALELADQLRAMFCMGSRLLIGGPIEPIEAPT